MLRRGRKLLLAVALLAASLSACTRVGGEGYGDPQNFDLIQRGRYLVTLGDCTACHADPTRSDSPFGGGTPVPTPFGTLIAPNITPDPQTGIGNWTAQQFDDAVRRGRMPDGKRLYPAMPYPYFARMSAKDVRAMRAYLNTVTPVHHAVVSDRLSFPLSIRADMMFWDWLYFRSGDWRPRPDQSAAWNRGSYIVSGPGHCGACHTPKTFLGGDEPRRALQGYSLQGWFAPDLTANTAHGPSYAWQLDDAQVAAVATSVRNSWGHAAGLVPRSAARAARQSPVSGAR